MQSELSCLVAQLLANTKGNGNPISTGLWKDVHKSKFLTVNMENHLSNIFILSETRHNNISTFYLSDVNTRLSLIYDCFLWNSIAMIKVA